jgi:hydrogenase expression/formation protein HypE
MRDATRGGLSGVLSGPRGAAAGRRVRIDETAIPVRAQTLYAAEMLGVDPLDVANEGKLVAVVPGSESEAALAAMRGHELGLEASIIGSVEGARDGLCELITDVGGSRIIQKPYGEELPRIC